VDFGTVPRIPSTTKPREVSHQSDSSARQYRSTKIPNPEPRTKAESPPENDVEFSVLDPVFRTILTQVTPADCEQVIHNLKKVF
jgi:hypothetical protein